MRSAATAAARVPRPPSSQSRGTARAPPTAGGGTAASETQLRRRLAEVEMRLRDIDDDAKRAQMHHERELAAMENDSKNLRERLEALRMEECMTPAEVRAMQTHIDLSGGTEGAHQGESRLLGTTSVKYQAAKAEVEAKRKECAVVERQLADVREHLAELRRRRQALKQEVFTTRASAGARMAAAQRYKVQVREQLRGLEEQVAREQERFSNMVVDAKTARTALDALLVNQTSNEKMYRRHYDALLDKRKEMAYLMEVCNALCEERQRVGAELEEMKAYLAGENAQYEATFHELTGVLDENAAVQATNREKMDELRRLIAQTKTERETLEAQNAETKTTLQRYRHRHMKQRLGDVTADSRDGNSGRDSEPNFLHRPSDEDGDEEGSKARDVDRSGVETSFGSSAILDGNQEQIREFEDYFQKLADIVQSDAIEDVVGFIDVAADERYRCFDEMNALKRDIAELTAEKATLLAQLTSGAAPTPATANASPSVSDGGGAATAAEPMARYGEAAAPTSPTAALAALAEVNSLEELTAATLAPQNTSAARRRSTSTADAPTSSSPAAAPAETVAQAAAHRADRMRRLQAELDTARDATAEQEEQREACSAVLSQVIAQLSDVFRGLGCSVAELRAITGLEGVQQSTLLPCLSLVEQRTEEYLLAYARTQQQHQQQQDQHVLNVWGEPTSTGATGGGSVHNVARTVLRRPDLPPKAKGGMAVQVSPQQLPRSTDVASMVPHISIDATSASTLETLVEERPLSDAEFREVVEAKRATVRH